VSLIQRRRSDGSDSGGARGARHPLSFLQSLIPTVFRAAFEGSNAIGTIGFEVRDKVLGVVSAEHLRQLFEQAN
jgi:hypothetical protein